MAACPPICRIILKNLIHCYHSYRNLSPQQISHSILIYPLMRPNMLQKNYQEFGRKFVSFHPKSFLAVPALVKSVKVICFLRFYNCVNFSKTRHGWFLEFMYFDFLLSTATDDVIVRQPFPLKNKNMKIGFL